MDRLLPHILFLPWLHATGNSQHLQIRKLREDIRQGASDVVETQPTENKKGKKWQRWEKVLFCRKSGVISVEM